MEAINHDPNFNPESVTIAPIEQAMPIYMHNDKLDKLLAYNVTLEKLKLARRNITSS